MKNNEEYIEIIEDNMYNKKHKDEDLLKVEMVYDGSSRPKIPNSLLPENKELISEKKQATGTDAEVLCEIAGRCCYDSFGKGRSTQEYHKHIKEVGHRSVWEHFHFTISATILLDQIEHLLNRPGLHVIIEPDIKEYQWDAEIKYDVEKTRKCRITTNLRTIFEWDQISPVGKNIRNSLILRGYELAPNIISGIPLEYPLYDTYSYFSVNPIHDHEQFISLYISGSRGFSHEMVRHRMGAVSQRSTRYCDEDLTPWVEHPLLKQFKKEDPENAKIILGAGDSDDLGYDIIDLASDHYSRIVKTLQIWLESKNVDKLTARKQARGAARGYLGNSLQTEMIYTTNVHWWKHFLKLRLHPAADAEIREIAYKTLEVLKTSQYGNKFSDLITKDSPDGIGKVLM